MRAPYEWLIGTRYLRSTQRRGFLSFISLVSMVGLALGVAVLIVVLSVMNGFERELRSRILSVTSHATLMGLEGTLPDWRARAAARARASRACRRRCPTSRRRRCSRTARALRRRHGARHAARRRSGARSASRSASSGGSSSSCAAGSYRIVLGDALAEELGVQRRRQRGADRAARAPPRRPASCRACAASAWRACSTRACTSSTAASRWCTSHDAARALPPRRRRHRPAAGAAPIRCAAPRAGARAGAAARRRLLRQRLDARPRRTSSARSRSPSR